VRASVAAFLIVSGVVPAVARELEFPLCVPRDKERAPAQELHVAPPEGAAAAVVRPFELVARITERTADITLGRPAHAPERFPRSLVAELPWAVPEGIAAHDLLWNAHVAGLLEAEFSAIRPLALWTAPPSILILRDADVLVPGDLKGLKIGVVGTDTAAVVEALGAIPVHLPAGEIYASLETGLIDGVISDPLAVSELDLDDVADSFTLNVPFGQTSYYLAMDRDGYDRLSEAAKASVDNIAGRTLSISLADKWADEAVEITESLKASGKNRVLSLTPEQRAAFLAVVMPVVDALVAEGGNEDLSAAIQGR